MAHGQPEQLGAHAATWQFRYESSIVTHSSHNITCLFWGGRAVNWLSGAAPVVGLWWCVACWLCIGCVAADSCVFVWGVHGALPRGPSVT